MASQRASLHFKLVMLGNAGVGKSCLVLRFIRGEFISDYESTIGAAFNTKILMLPDSDVKVEVWDTAGQERYRSLAPMYYRGAQAAIVVFDITARDSFEAAKTWVKELQKKMESTGMVIALCANKVDLAHNRQVDTEEAAMYARENSLIFVETSAKTDIHVTDLFSEIAARVPKKPMAAPRHDIKLGETAPATPAAGGCC